ncbi:hypothetical protein ABN034_22660 [Actinopolymorpha sp. B11F2]|uniref:hypothetical protein n=1 Tax=Actinopolymorpha sp. B11F2 TaxID=3160862 RepID=UPI0032E46CB6
MVDGVFLAAGSGVAIVTGTDGPLHPHKNNKVAAQATARTSRADRCRFLPFAHSDAPCAAIWLFMVVPPACRLSRQVGLLRAFGFWSNPRTFGRTSFLDEPIDGRLRPASGRVLISAEDRDEVRVRLNPTLVDNMADYRRLRTIGRRDHNQLAEMARLSRDKCHS